MGLVRIVYASAATKPMSAVDLGDLLLEIRTKNKRSGITGLLLYHKKSFFQILEGEEAAVKDAYAKIEGDKRHEDIFLILSQNVKTRNFKRWNMGFVDLDEKASHLTGFLKYMKAKSSLLDLQGDSKLVARLIDGFHEGRWRQSVSH
jgi:hypothetical protein